MKRLTPLLVFAAMSVLLLVMPLYQSVAHADDAGVVTVPAFEGSGAGLAPTQPPVTTPNDQAPPAPSSPALTPEADDTTLAKALYDAIHSKDWFMAVGVATALLIHLLRYLLKKKWSVFGNDKVAWVLAGAVSGLVALSAAWMAGKDGIAAHTLVGALKIFATAIAAYVSAKKLAPAPTA